MENKLLWMDDVQKETTESFSAILLERGILIMKKVTVNVSYEEEKLSALRLYLGQKNTTVEVELESALESLYGKTVPSNVREFLEMRSGIAGKNAEKKKKPTPATVSPMPERSEDG